MPTLEVGGIESFVVPTLEVGRIEVDKPVSMLVQYGGPGPSQCSFQIPGESTEAASCVFSFVMPTLEVGGIESFVVPTLEVGRIEVDKPVEVLTQYGVPVPPSNFSTQPLGTSAFGASCFFGIIPEVGRIEVDKPVSMLVQYGGPGPSEFSFQTPPEPTGAASCVFSFVVPTLEVGRIDSFVVPTLE